MSAISAAIAPFGVLSLALSLSASPQTTACLDALGREVQVRNDSTINDLGLATTENGRPVILFNQHLAEQFPGNVVKFFLAHECGHHALGHVIGMARPLTMEQAADCWAAQMLVNTKQFDVDDVRAVQVAIAAFGRADWTHLPGPVRAMKLPACLRHTEHDGCGIASALDEYNSSQKTMIDAQTPLRVIMAAEAEERSYSNCTTSELGRADRFLDFTVQAVQRSGRAQDEREQAVRAVRDSQRKIRQEIGSR